MTSDKTYRRLRQQLDTARTLDLLTDYGKDVRRRIKVAAADAEGRAGELTTLGARQHKAIARRMYDNYPTLLTKPLFVEGIPPPPGASCSAWRTSAWSSSP